MSLWGTSVVFDEGEKLESRIARQIELRNITASAYFWKRVDPPPFNIGTMATMATINTTMYGTSKVSRHMKVNVKV